MTLIIPRNTILKAVTHSFHELPYEACGLLVEIDGVITAQPCKNDSADQDSFEMCCDDLLLWHESGHRILGTYHSHPRGRAEPSEGDLELLEPHKMHLILGMKGGLYVQLWRYLGPRITPIQERFSIHR
jgi:proteasome lid subunit RPN8/RPN11